MEMRVLHTGHGCEKPLMSVKDLRCWDEVILTAGGTVGCSYRRLLEKYLNECRPIDSLKNNAEGRWREGKVVDAQKAQCARSSQLPLLRKRLPTGFSQTSITRFFEQISVSQ